MNGLIIIFWCDLFWKLCLFLENIFIKTQIILLSKSGNDILRVWIVSIFDYMAASIGSTEWCENLARGPCSPCICLLLKNNSCLFTNLKKMTAIFYISFDKMTWLMTFIYVFFVKVRVLCLPFLKNFSCLFIKIWISLCKSWTLVLGRTLLRFGMFGVRF